VTSPLPLPSWPNGAEVAVCLTFDVDAETPRLAEAHDDASRLSTLSEGRYGITRGLPRILGLLDRRSIRATFYVPGATAERHPEAIREIAHWGHEIAHHGHLHLQSHLTSTSGQRDEIVSGLAALADVVGTEPTGYRSPAWELTPETFGLLLEHGIEYDSSCMGDDRPYLEVLDGRQLLELPVHWSLDDWPYFGWSVDQGGNVSPASALRELLDHTPVGVRIAVEHAPEQTHAVRQLLHSPQTLRDADGTERVTVGLPLA